MTSPGSNAVVRFRRTRSSASSGSAMDCPSTTIPAWSPSTAGPQPPLSTSAGPLLALSTSASPALAGAAAGSYAVVFYANAANLGAKGVYGTDPGPRACSGTSDDRGCAYNYGYTAARHGFEYTAAKTDAAAGKAWWLDIETA